MLGLLKVLANSGEVNEGQMRVGFERMTDVVVDLKLDVPNAEHRLEGLKLMAKEVGIYPV